MNLNQRAAGLVRQIVDDGESLKIALHKADCATRIIDFGIRAAGSVEAGRRLAEVCLAGLGRVEVLEADDEVCGGPVVRIDTKQPLAACMASQYAGWQITGESFFAMGSGPIRAAAGKEQLFESIGFRESPEAAVGILETRQFPPDAVCSSVAAACGVPPENLTLLVAPTASAAGTVQVVARSVETAMHKLYELGFDLQRIASGSGSAPLPPIVADDLTAIGLTNDAILYGGRATLSVRGDDASLKAIGPRVPSCASPDFGQPFANIFERYHRDFYKIDPHLFSPAVLTFVNVDTGRTYQFGHSRPDVLRQSFGPHQGGA